MQHKRSLAWPLLAFACLCGATRLPRPHVGDAHAGDAAERPPPRSRGGSRRALLGRRRPLHLLQETEEQEPMPGEELEDHAMAPQELVPVEEHELRAGQGQVIDYNRETKIYWADESPLPTTIEWLMAVGWVTLAAAIPLLVLYDNFTRVQGVLAVVMWAVLLCGVFLFHRCLLFQSSHFQAIRSLTLVECAYFMSQVLTTVGYGDIVPARPAAQVFVSCYAVFCMLIIANFVSELFGILGDISERLHDRVEGTIHESKTIPRTIRMTLVRAHRHLPVPSLHFWLPFGRPPVPWGEFARSSLAYAACVIIGMVFYCTYPGEGKSIVEGLFMSVMTLSTVGLGVVTPVTECGKVFGAYWMLIGSTCLVRLIGSFSNLMSVIKSREQWMPSEAFHRDHDMLETLPRRIDRVHFLQFALLQAELVPQEDLSRMQRAFQELSPDAKGTISKEKVLVLFSQLEAPAPPAEPQAPQA